MTPHLPVGVNHDASPSCVSVGVSSSGASSACVSVGVGNNDAPPDFCFSRVSGTMTHLLRTSPWVLGMTTHLRCASSWVSGKTTLLLQISQWLSGTTNPARSRVLQLLPLWWTPCLWTHHQLQFPSPLVSSCCSHAYQNLMMY